MKEYIDAPGKQIAETPPNLDSSESVLTFLYETYSQVNKMDNTRTKADLNALYQVMNGMNLQEKDRILTPSVPSAGIIRGLGLFAVYRLVSVS